MGLGPVTYDTVSDWGNKHPLTSDLRVSSGDQGFPVSIISPKTLVIGGSLSIWAPFLGLLLARWWYTYPSEKYESVGMIIPNIIWKIKKCSKPPTSWDPTPNLDCSTQFRIG